MPTQHTRQTDDRTVQNPLQQFGASNLGAEVADATAVREERATTEHSAEQRQLKSGAALIGQRIEVQGKGKGVVLDTLKAKGKATEHLVMFDSGNKREAVLLSKDWSGTGTGTGTGTSGRGKGHRFWVLHDAVQVRAEPSRSQC